MVRLCVRLAPLCALLVLVAPVAASQGAATADVERLGQKLQAVLDRAVSAAEGAKPLTTSFTENELNAYLRMQAEADPSSGVRQPTVTLLDADKIETRALIDLDAVRTAETRGWLDPLAYVSGLLDVRTVATFKGANGKGTFAFESAAIDGVRVPKALLEELLVFYTRSPEWPQGIKFDEPFDLPARIREVQLRRGVITVVQ